MNIDKIFNELEKKFKLLITENTVEVSCKKESYPEQYVLLNINGMEYYDVTIWNFY